MVFLSSCNEYSCFDLQFNLQQEEVGDTHSCGDLLYAGGELNWTLLFL